MVTAGEIVVHAPAVEIADGLDDGQAEAGASGQHKVEQYALVFVGLGARGGFGKRKGLLAQIVFLPELCHYAVGEPPLVFYDK